MVDKYRYCPYCRTELGSPNPHRHCPGCGVTLYHNAAATAGAAIINDRGEVLFGRRALEPYKGTLDFIGGFINPGESALQALRREIAEETGLTDIDIIQVLGTYPGVYAKDAYTLNIIHVARLRSGEPKAADDVASFEWHPASDLPLEAFHDSAGNTRQAVADLQHWYHKHAAMLS